MSRLFSSQVTTGLPEVYQRRFLLFKVPDISGALSPYRPHRPNTPYPIHTLHPPISPCDPYFLNTITPFLSWSSPQTFVLGVELIHSFNQTLFSQSFQMTRSLKHSSSALSNALHRFAQVSLNISFLILSNYLIPVYIRKHFISQLLYPLLCKR